MQKTLQSVTGSRQFITLPLLLLAVLAGLSLLPLIQANERLLWSFQGATAFTFLWWLAVVIRAAKNGRQLEFEIRLVKTHYVQAAVLSCIYAYWGWYWQPVYDHVPLIAGQLAFAFLFEMLLSWSRGRAAVLGFGPVPIILSMNLFLWFRDDWFYLQFLLVATGFLGKEFIRWNRDGRRTHIFNPSAIALSVFAAGLIATGSTDLTWGREIAIAQFRPDHIYVEIFLLGLVVQALFATTLVTVTAAASLWLLSSIYLAVTGVYFFGDSTIPIAIFLGLHFLVTDPATSPRTLVGRALFGTFYGVAAFVLFGVLQQLGQPTFYDKLLAVPVLNLSVQVLDRIARSATVERMISGTREFFSGALQANAVHMAAWIAIFAGMLLTGEVGADHRGRQVGFWEQACTDERRNACESLVSMQALYCEQDNAAACNYLGDLFMSGELVARNPAEAMTNYRRACALGVASACVEHGGLSQRRRDYVAGLEAACEQDHGESCALLGYAYYQGETVARDEARALMLVQKACALGFEQACGIGAAPVQ